jgi:hypothetical protein
MLLEEDREYSSSWKRNGKGTWLWDSLGTLHPWWARCMHVSRWFTRLVHDLSFSRGILIRTAQPLA